MTLKLIPGTEEGSEYIVIWEEKDWSISFRPFIDFRNDFFMVIFRIRFTLTGEEGSADPSTVARALHPCGWTSKNATHASFTMGSIPLRISSSQLAQELEIKAQKVAHGMLSMLYGALEHIIGPDISDEITEHMDAMLGGMLIGGIVHQQAQAAAETQSIMDKLGMTPPPPSVTGKAAKATKPPTQDELDGLPSPKKTTKKTPKPH